MEKIRSKLSSVPWRWPMLAISLLGTLLVEVTLSGPGHQAAAALIQDPWSLLSQRSPGARGEVDLLQTKPSRTANALRPEETPSERVLSSVRTKPGQPSFITPAPALPADVFGDLFPAIVGEAPDAGVPTLTSFPISGGGIIAGAIGGGMGGGGFGTGGAGSGGSGGGTPVGAQPVTSEVTPGPPIAAVPEPATWLSMILGFGLIGLAMRRKSKVTISVAYA